MQQIQPLLERIGLNHHESTVYLHLLSHGELPASKISMATKIPRSTVRGVLDKLCERAIVAKMYKRNTQYYSCKPPSSLMTYLEQTIETAGNTLQDIRLVLPLLKSLHGKRNIVPKVRLYEGPEQVKEAFNSTLFAPGVTEILTVTSYDFLSLPLLKKNDDEYYIPLRVKKGIPLRTLVGRTKLKYKYVRSEPHELRHRRFLPKSYKFPGTFYIYGNSVLYFSASEGEYIAITVESSLMADTMRSLFEFMWEQCG